MIHSHAPTSAPWASCALHPDSPDHDGHLDADVVVARDETFVTPQRAEADTLAAHIDWDRVRLAQNLWNTFVESSKKLTRVKTQLNSLARDPEVRSQPARAARVLTASYQLPALERHIEAGTLIAEVALLKCFPERERETVLNQMLLAYPNDRRSTMEHTIREQLQQAQAAQGSRTDADMLQSMLGRAMARMQECEVRFTSLADLLGQDFPVAPVVPLPLPLPKPDRESNRIAALPAVSDKVQQLIDPGVERFLKPTPQRVMALPVSHVTGGTSLSDAMERQRKYTRVVQKPAPVISSLLTHRASLKTQRVGHLMGAAAFLTVAYQVLQGLAAATAGALLGLTPKSAITPAAQDWQGLQ